VWREITHEEFLYIYWASVFLIDHKHMENNNEEISNGPVIYCLGTGVRAYVLYMSKLQKSLEKLRWRLLVCERLTLIILKDIKCFQIWAYFEGIGINFNFENIQNKIIPLFILRTIQCMHARYNRTLQHLSKIEDWFCLHFVFPEMLKIVAESG
jgi:hypothetical protein